MRTLLVRAALAAVIVASLGACMTIPERAWVNGQAMSASPDYQKAMWGMDLRERMAAQRSLQSAANPLRLSSPVRWTPSSSYDK